MNRTIKLSLAGAMLAAGTGCDYTGDWLFAGAVEGVPGIIHIFNQDGGEYLVPSTATSMEELRDDMIYGEIGPTGGVARGGMTVNFQGTGGPVCVFVDPETVFWSWSIDPKAVDLAKQFNYPDNIYDDGDIDIFVGLSAHYTGSPGVEVGDFEVSYTDSLGNEVPLELSVCTNIGWRDQDGAHAGRGFPEFCSVDFTDPGVSYTALLQTFSTPLDDDRLGYGLFLWDGDCDDMIAMAAAEDAAAQECIVMGESIFPAGDAAPRWGYDASRAWNGSEAVEVEFCKGLSSDLRSFCKDEAKAMANAGLECQTFDLTSPDNRCYCGDLDLIPEPGAL
jgi:hypothetical protein